MKKILLLIFVFLSFVLPIQAEQISNDARLEYNHGLDYYKNGEYDKAMASFRRAISLSPDYIDAYYNLGSILEYLEQYDYALEMFKQIILRKPEDTEAVYKAGLMAYRTGNYYNAQQYLNLVPVQSKYYTKSKQILDSIGKTSTPKKYPTNITNKAVNSETNLFEGLASPTGVVSDIFGNIYVAHFTENSITKISVDNLKTTYVKSDKINGPIGMAIDVEGNLYIANYNANNVVKIKPTKEVSVLIGNIKQPYGLFIRDGILYVSLQRQNALLKYRLKF